MVADKYDSFVDQNTKIQKHGLFLIKEKNLKKMRDLANDPKFKATSYLHRP